MISKVRKKCRHILQTRYDRQFIPEHLQAGDTFIVAFPKSGVTWLTMLVANAFAIKLGVEESITFNSVRRFIPDLNASRAVAPRLSPSGIGFYKSHATFNRNYCTTIYLVRHPFPVMQSYHKYRRGIDLQTPADLGAFSEDPRTGIKAWKRHVQSWVMNPHDTAQRHIHLVRYEELLQDAGAVLAELEANLGWGLTDATIAKAVERSTRGEMHLQEERYRRNNPMHTMKFVGAPGGTLDPSIAKKINTECGSELQKLGYKVDAS